VGANYLESDTRQLNMKRSFTRRRPNWSSADSRGQTGVDETGSKDINSSRLGLVRQQLARYISGWTGTDLTGSEWEDQNIDQTSWTGIGLIHEPMYIVHVPPPPPTPRSRCMLICVL
jgi:hypothetical protein